MTKLILRIAVVTLGLQLNYRTLEVSVPFRLCHWEHMQEREGARSEGADNRRRVKCTLAPDISGIYVSPERDRETGKDGRGIALSVGL